MTKEVKAKVEKKPGTKVVEVVEEATVKVEQAQAMKELATMKPTVEKAKVKVEKGPSITRTQAAALAIKAIKKEATIKDIIIATDKIYIQHGGSAANPKESKTQVCKALQILEVFGLIEVNGEVVKKVQQ